MVWRLFTLMMGVLPAVAFAAMAAGSHAAPATDAQIAEVGAALNAGDAAHALLVAGDGLKAADATALQRGRLLLDRGLAQELLGAVGPALEDFTAALQTRALPPPERAQALLQRGFLLDGLNQLDDAAKDYTAVITLKAGGAATALNNRANIWRRQNKPAGAKRDYLAALAAGSDKPQFPYYGLGQIAEAQHDGDSARSFYAKAVASDPSYNLAADRLAALGGAPEGTLSQPDKIVLQPPVAKPAKAPAAVAAAAGTPVPLHVPPPQVPKLHSVPAGAPGPGLRPALDGPSDGQGPQVQLGAWRSEPEAQAAWDKAHSRSGTALEGLTAHVVIADLPGKGRYFRLRVTTPDPTRLCARLKATGQDCALAH